MPFTPYHFGPGLFLKSLGTRHLSWFAFIASQVVIDCETLYYLVQHAHPVHRFFHTFLGATIAGVVTGIALMAVMKLLSASRWSRNSRPWLKAETSNPGLFLGALLGGITHPFLDGLMHRDTRPFAPWSQANPLLDLVGTEALHLACLLLGVAGLIILALRVSRDRAR